MKRGIAFFDFDGTITKKDTLLEFIKFCKGSFNFYIGFIIHFPILFAYKIGIVTNQKAKEAILYYFFKNISITDFHKLCDQFEEEVLPMLIRKGAYTEIKKLQEKGFTIVIVSASPEDWIKKWADINKIGLIATKLVVKNNKLNGKISGLNCYGDEKVRRIKEIYDLKDFEKIYAYGDSAGDKPMLALAHHSFMKPFR